MVTQATSLRIDVPEVCELGAIELACDIRTKRRSCVDVMSSYLDHIEAANPPVNALVSLRERSELLAEASLADMKLRRNDPVGPLHGVPQAIKDLASTAGLRTTFGSPIFANHVPDEDDIFVARLRSAGAIFIGKTNVPEFGWGSNSYNPIFGLTRNAYDQSKVGGGSSGGAAVALAMRMLPVADGSDMGGSLRNPAAFNNVFGFRPSQGRVPMVSVDPFYTQMGIDGAMGRSVDDVAMLLDIQSGYDIRAPLSLETAPGWLDNLSTARGKDLRFGWLGDFGGYLPFEPGVLELTEHAGRLFETVGAAVENVCPEFSMDALWRAFVVLRQQAIGGRYNAYCKDPATRKLLKAEAIWEIEGSCANTALDVYNAGLTRGAWYQALLKLFETFDFLLLPAAQVFPFDDILHWPGSVAGKKMDSYHRWMEVVIGPTMAGLPTMCVPAGFRNDLPMGLQIIGHPRGDRKVIEAALLFEELAPWISRRPTLLR